MALGALRALSLWFIGTLLLGEYSARINMAMKVMGHIGRVNCGQILRRLCVLLAWVSPPLTLKESVGT